MLLAFALACVPDTGVIAPADAEIVTPEDIEISWNSDVNQINDGYGTLILFQFAVVDEDDLPIQNVQMEIMTGSSGIYILPESAIRMVNPPDPEAAGSDCDPGSEFYDVRNCPWYDNASQSYFQLSHNYSDSENGEDLYRPNYLLAASDNHGTLRVWAFVDRLPAGDGGFSDGYLLASIGALPNQAGTVLITASE